MSKTELYVHKKEHKDKIRKRKYNKAYEVQIHHTKIMSLLFEIGSHPKQIFLS